MQRFRLRPSAGIVVGQLAELLERQDTHFTVLERDGPAGVAALADPVEPHDLTVHVAASDLLAAIFRQH